MKKILKGKKASNDKCYSGFYDRYFEVEINGKSVTVLEGGYNDYHCETFIFINDFNIKKLKQYKNIDIQPVTKNGRYSIRTVSNSLEATIKALKKIDRLFGIVKDDIEGLELMATETAGTGYKLVS